MRYLASFKRMAGLLAALAIFPLLFSSCAEGGEDIVLKEAVSVSYDTATAAFGDITSVNQYDAYVRAETHSLYFEGETGALGAIHVKIGDTVAQGDLIAELDVAGIEASLGAARDNLAHRRRQLEHDSTQKQLDMEILMLELEDLRESGNTQQAALLEYDYKKLENELNSITEAAGTEIRYLTEQLSGLEKTLAASRIYSPVDGEVVGTAPMLPGERVSSAVVIATIADPDSLYIQYDGVETLGSYETTALYNGVEYPLTAIEYDRDDYIQLVLAGRKPPAMYTFDGDPGEISAGAFVSLYVYNSRTENVLRIPTNAVYTESGVSYVYLIENNEKVYREIGCGARTISFTEVTWGLEEGDVVYVKQ